jgi:hypothetical protein
MEISMNGIGQMNLVSFLIDKLGVGGTLAATAITVYCVSLATSSVVRYPAKAEIDTVPSSSICCRIKRKIFRLKAVTKCSSVIGGSNFL